MSTKCFLLKTPNNRHFLNSSTTINVRHAMRLFEIHTSQLRKTRLVNLKQKIRIMSFWKLCLLFCCYKTYEELSSLPISWARMFNQGMVSIVFVHGQASTFSESIALEWRWSRKYVNLVKKYSNVLLQNGSCIIHWFICTTAIFKP